MTLTGRLDEGAGPGSSAGIVGTVWLAIEEPLKIGDVCLCGQGSLDADFRILGRFALACAGQ